MIQRHPSLRLLLLFPLALGATANAQSPKSAMPATKAATPAADPCTRLGDWLCAQQPGDAQACAAARMVTPALPPAACTAALADPERGRERLAEMSQGCKRLMDRACGDLGVDSQTCRETRDQLASALPSQCAVMAAGYAELIAGLREKEAALHPLPPALLARLAAPGAPSFGPADAKVTLVEFADFECPFCVKASITAAAIFKRFGSQVHFVFRQLPLAAHPHSELAARAALEAQAQGRFWPFHDAAFSHPADLDRAGLEKRATEAGLALEPFKQALDSNAHADAVAADLALAREAHVDATPTLFLDGSRVADPTNVEAVLAAIGAALGGIPVAPAAPAPR